MVQSVTSCIKHHGRPSVEELESATTDEASAQKSIAKMQGGLIGYEEEVGSEGPLLPFFRRVGLPRSLEVCAHFNGHPFNSKNNNAVPWIHVFTID